MGNRHLSPLYNITALWVKEVLRILRSGNSGTTLKSMYRIGLACFFEGGARTLVRFSAGFSHGWAANPEYFVRPYSQAIAVLRFMSLSSSSSVDSGRPNSRERPFGAWTRHPRTTRFPASRALPVIRTWWKELAGTRTEIGLLSKVTPEVLGSVSVTPIR